MYRFKELERVHLELTDKCNAACPMCGRNWYGGPTNQNLPLTELSLEDIKKIFPTNLLKNLKEIYVCGNFGDAIMAKDTLAIFRYMRESSSSLALGMYTNGSGRTSSWWHDLGTFLSNEHDYCRFSIDGLEDTNHLYRRNTDWKKIMASATSFINGGGQAVWEFIVFRHNQHQVDDARKIAKKMGFKKFQVIQSGRFLEDNSDTGVGWKNAHPVYSKEGDYEYCIQPASKVSNPGLKKGLKNIIVNTPTFKTLFNILRAKEVVHFPKTFDRNNEKNPGLGPFDSTNVEREHYFDNHCVDCKAQTEKSLYIGPQGYVTPCCWTGYALYSERNFTFINQMKDIFFKMNLHEINALERPLDKIIESDFFQKKFPDGWKQKSIEDGQVLICSKYCGDKLSTVKDEYAIAEELLN